MPAQCELWGLLAGRTGLAGSLEDGPVLAEVLRQIGRRPELKPVGLLKGKLGSLDAAVRAAAVEALPEVEPASLHKVLEDREAVVRCAAATAAGKLGVRTAVPALLNLARDGDSAVRGASLESLRLLKEARAVPFAVAALADPRRSW